MSIYDFYRERAVKATRKPHWCCACATEIQVDSSAKYIAGVFEGSFMTGYYHSDCRAAEIALNDLHDTWGDEFYDLASLLQEDEDKKWLRETFPLVAERILTAKPGEDVTREPEAI